MNYPIEMPPVWAYEMRKQYLMLKYRPMFAKKYLKSKRYVTDTVLRALKFLANYEIAKDKGLDDTAHYDLAMYLETVKELVKLQNSFYYRRKNMDVNVRDLQEDREEMIQRARDYPMRNLIEIGKNNMLCCPFHDDKKPSAKYYEENNRIHCFVCNKSWDAIGYIMEKEGVSFVQAVLRLT